MKLPPAAAALLLAGCTAAPAGSPENGAVYAAWAAHASRVEVLAQGSVARDLGIAHGRSGTHEGFLLHLSGGEGHGLTVRVEANLDMTGPLPIQEGEAVRVRGEYVYDPRGGLIHWTHRDPRGRHPAGFVEIHGHRYQ